MNGLLSITTRRRGILVAIVFLSFFVGRADAGERTQRFDSDPKWQASNNHLNPKGKTIEVSQDFGYCTSKFAGDTPGKLAGW